MAQLTPELVDVFRRLDTCAVSNAGRGGSAVGADSRAGAKGEAPAGQKPRQATVAPSSPQIGGARPKTKETSGGPSPWIVVGVALAAGIVLAKWIDWRGHAHTRN